jgi:antitoxin ParD1/3/4
MEKLSITVTEEQAALIQSKVDSGQYGSASEVIRAGLRSLERDEELHREQIESIRARVQASINDTRPRVSMDEMHAHAAELSRRARERGFR